jgi:rod shape determining protein RodA
MISRIFSSIIYKLKTYEYKRYNFALLILVLVLGGVGAFLIKHVPKDGNSLFIKHLAGLALGIILAIVISLIDYHFIAKFYIILYVINLILLVLVKLIGKTYNHAQRWLDIGISFQPSELSKIILIIFLAYIFSVYSHKINNAYVIIFSVIAVGMPTFLILIQTNLSTSLVIMFIFAMMIFAAGLSWKIILPILIIGIPSFMGLFWYIQQDYQTLLKDYQQERVLSILNPELYPDTMYQQGNSIQAIGSGQLYGKLLANSTQERAYNKIPISESDFIFSIAGEELGFIGCCIIIGLFAVVIYLCMRTAKRAPDRMGMLIAIGMASMFMFQVFVNIGVATQIMPNTGIPLPFVSSGLSSLVSAFIAIGIILNINLQPKKIRGSNI